MNNIKGRGTQRVRPGLTIKGVLMGEIPLTNEQLVTEAACVDVHQVYRKLIKIENATRKKPHKLKGMNYQSFSAQFRFAKYLGLIELTREEPLRKPPPGGPLLNPVKNNGVHVVVTMRRLYRLTQAGRDSDKPWLDLRTAWMKAREMESSS